MTKRRSSTVRFFVTTFAIFLFAIAARSAFADQEGRGFGYTATTPDGKHIFVVLGYPDPPYPASGMYRNDGSTVPLWTIDWYARALVPSGGEHLVRLGNGPRWSGSYHEEALTFFSNGRPLKTYTAAELIDLPWLLPRWSHSGYGLLLGWGPSKNEGHAELTFAGDTYANESVTFDEQGKTVELLTVLGDRLTFDLTTGEILSAKHPATLALAVMFAILLVGYAVFRKMYRGTGSDLPWVGPSNVLVGGLFTLALTVIPAAAVWSFCVSDYPEYDSYRNYIAAGFETLPWYVVAFFGFESTENTPTGSGFVACFWFACVAVFTTLDRFIVWIGERVGRPWVIK